MAIERILLDPNATSYTDNEIVGKINIATVNISRAESVDAVARPIGDLEIVEGKIAANAVSNAKLALAAAKDNLDAIEELDREYVKTNPQTGEYKVTGLQVDADGMLAVDKNDIAEVA